MLELVDGGLLEDVGDEHSGPCEEFVVLKRCDDADEGLAARFCATSRARWEYGWLLRAPAAKGTQGSKQQIPGNQHELRRAEQSR